MRKKSRLFWFSFTAALVVSAGVVSWLAFGVARSARPVGWDELEHADADVVAATAAHEFETVQEFIPLMVAHDSTGAASGAGPGGADAYSPGASLDPSRSSELEARRTVVLDAIQSGTVSTDGEEVPDHELEILLEEVSKFFAYRFGTTDPTAYITWREDTGYAFIGWEWLHRSWDFDPAWEIFLPEEPPMPDSGDHRLPFAKLFNVVPDWGDTNRNRVVAISAESKGIAIVLGEVKAGGIPRADLRGVWPVELWEGGTHGSLCPWWTPPRSVEEISRAHGVCRFARVGVLVESGDGLRRPYIGTWLWDPQQGWWFLDRVSRVAHDGNTGAAVCY